MKREYWSIIRSFLPSIMIGFVFMFLILLLKPSILWVALGVSMVTVFFSVRSGQALKIPYNLMVNLSVLFLLYFIWKLIGGIGVIGLVVAVLLAVGILLYLRRKLFINTIREIEKIIWGRTNDRKP